MTQIKNIIANFKKYAFLMQQLISRDFKVKYKRSVLGVLWSLLNPLLMMGVMALVFSQMFKFRMEGVNFLVYLMTGLVMWNYFSEATSSAMTSVVGNFSLMNKVYIPKYIFPLTKVLFVGINFVLTLIPLFAVIIVSDGGSTLHMISWWYLLLPIIFILLILFTMGVGLFLSSTSVFLRDIFYIYGIVLTIWNYLTPTFYDIAIIPERIQFLFKLNPLYMYISSAREIILFGNAPSIQNIAGCFIYAVLALLIGGLIFKKNQDKFIYYA